ncbi:MAG: hypothetical protein DHS20C11_20710 [Lysobacteraceae bacterium]|nr:MAG: hypothetical protein DHS20C11_20710 [Xanthomonadaceae bacterium]
MKQGVLLCLLLGFASIASAQSFDEQQQKAAAVAKALQLEHGPSMAAVLTMATWAVMSEPSQDSDQLARVWQSSFDRLAWLGSTESGLVAPAAVPIGNGPLAAVFLATLPGQGPSYRSQDPMTPGSESHTLLQLVVRGEDERLARALLSSAMRWVSDHGDWVWLHLLQSEAPNEAVASMAMTPWLNETLQASTGRWLAAAGSPELLSTSQALELLLSGELDPSSLIVAQPTDADRWLSSALHTLIRSRGLVDQPLIASLNVAQVVEMMTLGLLSGATSQMATLLQSDLSQRWAEQPWAELDGGLRRSLDSLGQAIVQISAGDAVAARETYAVSAARLRWLAEELQDYRSQPARSDFNNDQLACVGMARTPGGLPQEPITSQQYQGCLRGFALWGTVRAAEPVMAGPLVVPVDREPLQRELSLEPWQRLNMLRALANEGMQTSCINADQSLANALEWSEAATAFAWFADQWPSLFASNVELKLDLDRLIDSGQLLAKTLGTEFDCGGQRGAVLQAAVANYGQALQRLAQAVSSVRQRFLAERLAPEADLDLAGSPDQVTRYQPSSRLVGPCNATPSCGVNAQLPASRALFGLFPSSYLIAEQLGLSSLELCYTNVQWVDRRSLPSEVTNRAMASYFGKLSFELVGAAEGERNVLFVHRLTDLEEHQYLYGENTPDVLDEGCPEARVGTRVVTSLPEQTFQLVPRRLTYMTAVRETPAQLFSRSWDQGPEWRDWFVTEREVETLVSADYQFDSVLIAERMRELNRELNTVLYAALQQQETGLDWPELSAVSEAADGLEHQLAVTRQLARLYAPMLLQRDERWRSAFYGTQGLLSEEQINLGYGRVSADDLLRQAVEVAAQVENDLATLLPTADSQYPAFMLEAMLELNALRSSLATNR